MVNKPLLENLSNKLRPSQSIARILQATKLIALTRNKIFKVTYNTRVLN